MGFVCLRFDFDRPVDCDLHSSSGWLMAEDWPLPTILNQNQLAIASESGEATCVFSQSQGVNE